MGITVWIKGPGYLGNFTRSGANFSDLKSKPSVRIPAPRMCPAPPDPQQESGIKGSGWSVQVLFTRIFWGEN